MSANGKTMVSLAEMKPEVVQRLPTGIAPLDLIYGRTKLLDACRTDSGLPVGKVSLWSGESGVGKTRLAITVTKLMNAMGARVLVGQGEVPPEDFAQWTGDDVRHPELYWVTDDNEVEALAGRIAEVKPHIVVYDSVNMIAEVTHRTRGKEVMQAFSRVVAKAGCHAILIGQLNADKSAKGGTEITHLVDVHAKVYWFDSIAPKLRNHVSHDDVFIFEIPKKNRYVGEGKPKGWVAFRHARSGVVVFDSILNHPATERGWQEWVAAGMP